MKCHLSGVTENQLSFEIIRAAIDLHKQVGPGLLESAYENALAFDLGRNGHLVEQQVPLPFFYKEVHLQIGYRVDLLIDSKVIVEVKSLENIAPVHFAQLLTYLKLSEKKLGLLINFNSKLLKGNIHRLVNNLEE